METYVTGIILQEENREEEVNLQQEGQDVDAYKDEQFEEDIV